MARTVLGALATLLLASLLAEWGPPSQAHSLPASSESRVGVGEGTGSEFLGQPPASSTEQDWQVVVGDHTGRGPLSEPRGITIDGDGNLYVADRDNHRIWKFSATGEPLTRWGGRPGRDPVHFRFPEGVALDGDGNIYVADTGNHRVQVLAPTGHLIAQWGSEGRAPGQFRSPTGVAVDRTGDVYVADPENQRIQKFSPDGVPITQWGYQESSGSCCWFPTAVASDHDGYVYAVDGLSRVLRFSADGAPLARWSSMGGQPGGVTVNRAGDVYVTGLGLVRRAPPRPGINKFSPSGEPLAYLGSDGEGPGQFRWPHGVAVDAEGNLYVADTGNHRIQKLPASAQRWVPTAGSCTIARSCYVPPERLRLIGQVPWARYRGGRSSRSRCRRATARGCGRSGAGWLGSADSGAPLASRAAGRLGHRATWPQFGPAPYMRPPPIPPRPRVAPPAPPGCAGGRLGTVPRSPPAGERAD
jgi:DNA-binding beta-propeller fold protein YncE